MNKILKLDAKDNVVVALSDLKANEVIDDLLILEDIAAGHKVALQAFKVNENIIKYGNAIGHASIEIKKGQEVHTHNCKTNLNGIIDYTFNKEKIEINTHTKKRVIKAYQRKNGIGIRNDLWIVVSVGCINSIANKIVKEFNKMHPEILANYDGIYAITHPFGCSQLGYDHENTVTILKDIITHPNAGGVLVLGLGCENNQVDVLRKQLGDYDETRVKFLIAQEVEDEVSSSLGLLEELYQKMLSDHRVDVDFSKLVLGLKCGGSDGFSGISANPLLGFMSNKHTINGGSVILSEVPEMFGAEHLLMNRSINADIFLKNVSMINRFKEYFTSHHVDIYENPSPGNKKGGITTLEDKSLGCVMKSGNGEIVDILDYGEKVKAQGISLLYGPGNDLVATTALGASGCHMVLFTTGRGTPFGSFIPTMKISTNSALFTKKNNWIDFNAGVLLEDASMEDLSEVFLDYIAEVASGTLVKSESYHEREIAIFKQGVTL